MPKKVDNQSQPLFGYKLVDRTPPAGVIAAVVTLMVLAVGYVVFGTVHPH